MGPTFAPGGVPGLARSASTRPAPAEALAWRRGHLRGAGLLPDLFFPADRSWLASALWDDTWTDFGGWAELVAALQRNSVVNARQVHPDEDAVAPGVTRE
jgi:hypothetical protein